MIYWLKRNWTLLLVGGGIVALWIIDMGAEPVYPPADCVVEYGPSGPFCA